MLTTTRRCFYEQLRCCNHNNHHLRSSGLGSKNSSFLIRSFGSDTTAASTTPDLKTALYDYHKTELGGKMVSFAGYELPVFYSGNNGGVMKEHLWCRSIGQSSLFDVSHMGQIRWHGKDRVKFLESLVVGDIGNLKESEGCLSLITNEMGGILDDTVITNAGNFIYMVVNGATKHNDMKHFLNQLENGKLKGLDVTMEYLEDSYQLLALQGPGAANAIQKLLPSTFYLTNMPFMTGTETTIDGIPGCRITRCGYTGEDGFEIAMPYENAVSIAAKLLSDETVNPTGLGARDSLRLEAGLCLYGHDLNETTTPIEGALGWTLGPPGSRRRTEQGFLGADKILKPDGKFQPIERKRVGILGSKASGPAREGSEIYDMDNNLIGIVTSGTYSPSLNVPIAMGFVKNSNAKVGTSVQLSVRGVMRQGTITKMPFVETRYYRVPK